MYSLSSKTDVDIERGVGTLVRAPDLIVKDDIIRPRFLLNVYNIICMKLFMMLYDDCMYDIRK